MIQDIDRHISIINDSLKWAKDFRKDSFPAETFKDYRRRLKKIRKALEGNCSAAAYGESQVGKSYLMSSLLSSTGEPFVIENNGKEYSFINDLNPSGGNNTKIESTGVITRFTLQSDPHKQPGRIKILNLSVVDIILLLTDSYYNDIKINPDTTLTYDAINREIDKLSPLWEHRQVQHEIIDEDDIRDIEDYIKRVIGNPAAAIYHSNFARVIAPVIQYIPYDKWIDVFGLLWNQNQELNRLFATLINAYKKIDFLQNIYVPFDAILRSKGTLLKIEWLDNVCGIQKDMGNDEIYTDVYDINGQLLASNFNKGDLSALIAELTFELPERLAEQRPFLKEMDLLDFPGARSREKFKESEISKVLPMMLRRGKVAYLFNKYARSLQISSVLFCHHNDQKTEPTIGEAINNWIDDTIGATPSDRAAMLRHTNNIAPLFFIATKFNIDLEKTLNDKPEHMDSLDKHWKRFDTVIPEIISPNRWLEEWISGPGDTSTLPFRNIYPLRDFYWSSKNNVFDGYDYNNPTSSEVAVHHHPDFPEYMERLHDSFLRNKFVQRHFADPERTWQDVATVNNDGSKAIIRNLDSISSVLDAARRDKYKKDLDTLKRELIATLEVYYEPEDIEAKNQKVRVIARDIRQSLMQTVANNPVAFGRTLDKLMISPESIRNIAYDILVRHIDQPRDFNQISFIRAMAGVDLTAPRDVNIRKLLDYTFIDTEENLIEYYEKQGIELEDIISGEVFHLSTIGDVMTKHIVEYWIEHLNKTAQEINETLPHADEVVFMLVSLFRKLELPRIMADRIITYTRLFDTNEQLNAIGDYASLVLNNFVSNVGRDYMTDDVLRDLQAKAAKCRLNVDFSPQGWNATRNRQPLMETLEIFDEASKIISSGIIDISRLRQLPFWNNYMRWENLVFIGLVYSSDISHCDPVCNEKVKNLIETSKALYNK